ncbi:MAG: phage tail tape measure protein [Aliishimia sp.]
MSDYNEIDELETRADGLSDTLGAASAMVAGFDGELRRMQSSLSATGADIASLERGLSKGLRKAFDGVVFDGMKLSDALDTVAQSMINAVYNSAIKPVTNQLGGVLSQGVGGFVEKLFPFENGGAFSSGKVTPFANGGVVGSPTMFPMRGGTGLMGEAGPEAIMPLTRGADGKLGVRSDGSGGGGPTIVMNITTPDAQSFQRSRGQIAAQMSRAMGRGQRNN